MCVCVFFVVILLDLETKKKKKEKKKDYYCLSDSAYWYLYIKSQPYMAYKLIDCGS